MNCRQIEVHCQAVGKKRPITFDWTKACARYWSAGEVRAENEVIRPSTPNGFQYRYTVAGQAGQVEPRFAREETAGTPYRDGFTTLVAEPISNDSLLRTVTGSTWPAVEGGTITDEGELLDNGEQKTWAYLQFDAPGRYRVRNDITLSDGSDVGLVDIDVS